MFKLLFLLYTLQIIMIWTRRKSWAIALLLFTLFLTMLTFWPYTDLFTGLRI